MKILTGLLRQLMPLRSRTAKLTELFPALDQTERAERYSKNGNELGFLAGVLESIKADDKTVLNIVQVGANDGVSNDPIYNYVRKNKDSTRILLIEPQPGLIPLLTENYRWHRSAFVAQMAIGPSGKLKLYKIKDQFHQYYRGIAASGITSVNRDYVLAKAVRNYGAYFKSDPNDYIEEISVECMNLPGALDRFKFGNRVDVLQVDAEGYDDEVIYHSDIPALMPSVVNYEFTHLNPQRRSDLGAYLVQLGYRVVCWSNDDECAIRNR